MEIDDILEIQITHTNIFGDICEGVHEPTDYTQIFEDLQVSHEFQCNECGNVIYIPDQIPNDIEVIDD